MAAGNCTKAYDCKKWVLFHEVGILLILTSLLTTDGTGRKMLIMFNWLAPLSQVLAQQSVPFSSSGSSLMPHSFTTTPASSSKPSQLSGGPFLSHPVLQALLSAPPPVLLELVNGLSDDIYSLSRLGLIGPKLGQRAARFADWCWLFTTLVGLVGNGVELGVIEGLQREGEAIKIFPLGSSVIHLFQYNQGRTKSRSRVLLPNRSQKRQKLTNVS